MRSDCREKTGVRLASRFNCKSRDKTKWGGVFLGLLLLATAGCGTTKSQLATQQLLTSDAIDRTVANIDFSVLSGQTVYFDEEYIDAFKPIGFLSNKYVVSALRQQIFAARCILVDKKDEADYILEARIGAMGTDEHDVTYGVPASSALNTAATVLASAPPVPVIPEISIARRQEQMGATKISVYAYHRETRTPVWQSGNSTSMSYAKSYWIFGAGPFQRGTIYKGTQFAGAQLRGADSQKNHIGSSIIALSDEHIFFENSPSTEVPQVAEKTDVAAAPETELK